MTRYTEKRGITTKIEHTEHDMIGWSCLDAAPIYRATITEFSIAKGLIARYAKAVNADGSGSACTHYRRR